jgi:hypothetical protein
MADANEKGPCCNPKSGWCGNIRGKSWGHCPTACKVCVDFGPKGEGLSRRAVGTADDPQREGNRRAAPKASDIHEWTSSNLNATPPDGARLHQSIGTEGMDERMADEDPENARRRRFVKSMMVSAWRGYERCGATAFPLPIVPVLRAQCVRTTQQSTPLNSNH